MKRNKNWHCDLADYLDETWDRSFEWGKHDCALSASNCLEVMTDVDPAEWFRGKYETEKGAFKALRKSPYGLDDEKDFNTLFTSVVKELALENDMEPVTPSFLHRGDLTLKETESGLLAMAIFVGNGVAVVSETSGWEIKPKPDHDYAWRLPY